MEKFRSYHIFKLVLRHIHLTQLDIISEEPRTTFYTFLISDKKQNEAILSINFKCVEAISKLPRHNRIKVSCERLASCISILGIL